MPSMSLKNIAYTISPSLAHPFLKKIEVSDIGSRLARGVFWSITGTVISHGMMLCASVLIARILGKSVYGELGMVRSTVGMLGVFAGFGLGLTATKHVAEFRKSDPERTGRIIGLSGLVAMGTGGLMALFMLVFAPWLAENTINAPHLVGVLRIGGLILFANALNGAQTGALSGFEAYKTIAHVNLVVGLSSFPILVCGAYFWGLNGAVTGLVINLSFNWLLNHFALRREMLRNSVCFTINKCSRELQVLWGFSLPAVLASLMFGPVNWLCSAMLVNQPGGYAEMGIFNAANQWYGVLLFLPGMISSVLLPIFSDQLNQQNTKQAANMLLLGIKINALIVFPIVIVICLISPFIMSLYGPDFKSGWPTLVSVLLTAGIVAIQVPVTKIIHAYGQMWTAFAMNCGWALTFIICTYLLIDYGAFGLASARTITQIIHSSWTFAFAIWIIRKC